MLPAALPPSGTIDLRTIGRRSGTARWTETWYVLVEGQVMLTGTPGRRDWLANLVADPQARVRFRDPVREVDFTARMVTDAQERRALVPLLWRVQPWYADAGHDLDAWVAAAPMVVLTASG